VEDLPDFDVGDEELRRTGAIKWLYAERDVLPAWVAELDVRPCPAVSTALHDAVERGAFGYPTETGPGVGEALSEFLATRFGWQVDPGHVVLTGDVMSGIRLAIETLCEDAPVIVPVPSYPPFLDAVPLTGRRLVEVPCASEDGDGGRPVLDLDAIGRELAAGARTVLLANPHNPLGRAFTAAELTGLRDVADAHGARVISDEVHAPLVLPGAAHVPYETVAGERAISVVSASKAWNIPGVKCAQLIVTSPGDLAALRRLPHVANSGTSSLGIAATIAAYTSGVPWLDGLLAHLDARRAQFGDLMARLLPQVGWQPMEATYLAWLDARSTGLPDPSAVALARGRVVVQQGAKFGAGYEGFARVNIGTSAERLEQVVTRLATAWT
jgi:cystathionine beta-lyase